MNIGLLEKLYLTHSKSHREEKMTELVGNELTDLRINFNVDSYGQIYNIVPGKPLLVHHMDQVQTLPCDRVLTIKNKIYGFSKKGKLRGLGADDKNGVFIALNAIRQFRYDVSFIFSCAEEAGGYLRYLTRELQLDTEMAPYGLIFDRRGCSDIIGTSNSYCCDDFELAVNTIAGDFNYKPTNGIFSDADELSEYIPCVNLSCGYYNAHTEEEYTNIGHLWRAMILCQRLIDELPQTNAPFNVPTKIRRYYGNRGWGHLDNAETGWSDCYKWDDRGYPIIPKSKTYTNTNTFGQKKTEVKTKTPITASDCELWVDNLDVTFIAGDEEDIWIAEDIEEAVGRWEVLDDRTLEIELDEDGNLVAWLDNESIEVHTYHQLPSYDYDKDLEEDDEIDFEPAFPPEVA